MSNDNRPSPPQYAGPTGLLRAMAEVSEHSDRNRRALQSLLAMPHEALIEALEAELAQTRSEEVRRRDAPRIGLVPPGGAG